MPRSSIFAAAAFCAVLMVATGKKVVRRPGAEPGASWSCGILVGDALHVTGVAGDDATGKIPGNFETELKQALENVGAVLRRGPLVVVANFVQHGHIEITVTAWNVNSKGLGTETSKRRP